MSRFVQVAGDGYIALDSEGRIYALEYHSDEDGMETRSWVALPPHPGPPDKAAEKLQADTLALLSVLADGGLPLDVRVRAANLLKRMKP